MQALVPDDVDPRMYLIRGESEGATAVNKRAEVLMISVRCLSTWQVALPDGRAGGMGRWGGSQGVVLDGDP